MESFFDSLPTGDLDVIAECFIRIKLLKERGSKLSEFELLCSFFMDALYPFYDAMWDGMESKAGHVIYRLSDNLPQETRQKIEVYPSEGGWDTLEDWRKEWEKLHPSGIPNFSSLGNFQKLLTE